MAGEKVLITEEYLEDMADAIREKLGTTDTYLPSEFADAISDISGGGGVSLGQVSDLTLPVGAYYTDANMNTVKIESSATTLNQQLPIGTLIYTPLLEPGASPSGVTQVCSTSRSGIVLKVTG